MIIFFNKNDHTHQEDNDVQYCALEIHQKGGRGAEIYKKRQMTP